MQELLEIRDALEKLESFLVKYKGDLDVQLGIYRSWIQNLDHADKKKKIVGPYMQNHFAEDESCIKRTINNIEQNDLPFIKRQIASIEELIQKLGR